MKRVILLGHRRVLWGTVMAACLVTSLLVPVSSADANAANPVPYVSQPLVPDAVAPGGPGFTLTVNGTGFVSGSVVNWNDNARATHFVSEGQLTATILDTDIAKPGTASVTVVNPTPGGGTSRTVFFPVAAPTLSVPLARIDFSSAGGNITVVTADFNGDGKLDLATAGYYDSTVRIFLGNGDRTFRIG
jgi:IPT/TIG domain/FG-GAP repeat